MIIVVFDPITVPQRRLTRVDFTRMHDINDVTPAAVQNNFIRGLSVYNNDRTDHKERSYTVCRAEYNWPGGTAMK